MYIKKIILLVLVFVFSACSTSFSNYFDKYNFVGIEYILKKHKIKVIDERTSEEKKEQKFFKKDDAIDYVKAILSYGEKTHYKYFLEIEKGDINNPKTIRIKRNF